MKKIIGLSIAIALIVALIGTGTWALFSDTEESTGNTFTAGTLNLTADVTGDGAVSGTVTPGDDGVNEYITLSNLKPGDNGTVTWTCTNTGTLAGTLKIDSTVTFSDVDANEPENAVTVPHGNNDGGNGDLDEFVGVRLQRGVGTDATDAESHFEDLFPDTDYRPFSQLDGVLDDDPGPALAADGGNDTIVYKLSWSIASDVKGAGSDGKLETGDDTDADDNIIQSDNAILDITFTLTQS